MKIVAFLGERYVEYGSLYYANPTSASFLQKMFGNDNVIIASQSKKVDALPQKYSSTVLDTNFISFPYYSSIKQFITNCFFKKKFLQEFINKSDLIIEQNPNAIFWVRTPTIGSIIFGLRVLKKKRILINHICADISNTWRDKKYSFPEKIFGYFTSKILNFMLSKLCSHKNTLNLTTGLSLEQFSKRYSNNTFQFVDLMIQSNKQITNKKNNKNLNLTFVGRIVKDKGIFDLLSVIAQLPKNIHLNIVGGGDDLDSAKAFTQKLNINSNVTFYGQLPFEEINSIYAITDLTIVPSNNYYEGFPRVIMESWSYGIPVIVSNVGGVNAFVKNNINGIIIPPGNQSELLKSIITIINNDILFKKLQAGANEMKEISSFEYWSNNTLALVKRHINEA
ncbi:glycosyltransferase [Providencia stuartii]|uniref:glycosyltransferase n=1 Tax=Providencia stuartii TaxID=588 RepID=UPI0034E519DA